MTRADNFPRTLFLPGAGADPEFWEPLGRRLSAAWPKRYLAWPGLGNNPASPEVSGWQDLVRLVESHMGEEPVNLVAQSLGGAVALEVARRRPRQVRRLVLATTAAGLDVAHLGASDWRGSYRLEYPNAASWVYTTQTGLDAHLPGITCKTLLIYGDTDPIAPLSVARYLEQRLPAASLHVVEGGTHALGSEAAEHLAPLVERFLRE